MNKSLEKHQNPQENTSSNGGFKSIIKKPWFITLILILVIIIGLVILLSSVKNSGNDTSYNNDQTNIHYTIINNNNISIPITIKGNDVNIVINRDNQVNNDIEISTKMLEYLKKKSIHINNINNNRCVIKGPIYIGVVKINDIKAKIVESTDYIFRVNIDYLIDILGPITIEDGIVKINQDESIFDNKYIALYFIGICFIIYLVCRLAFSQTITITYNDIDKYITIITGVALVIWEFCIEEDAPAEVTIWVKYITIVCGAISLIFTIVGNFPNPLYIFLGVMAKLFIVCLVAAIFIILICIFLFSIIIAIATRSNDNENREERWEFEYDEYLDKVIGTRRW